MEIIGSGVLNFDRAMDSRSENKVLVDLSKVDKIGLYDIVAIASVLLAGRSHNKRLEFIPPEHASVSNFVSRVGFGRFLKKELGIDAQLGITHQSEVKDVMVEIRTFDETENLADLQDLLWNQLATSDGLVRQTLDEALVELGDNVKQHAHGTGIVAAVVQGNRHRHAHIDLAIADIGIGIRQSFLRGPPNGHNAATDHEAISSALQMYGTSVPNDPGRGQGLTVTVESALEMQGTAIIRSGTAKRTITPGPKHSADSVVRADGTIVALRLPCRGRR